jgi:hypothetical protein
MKFTAIWQAKKPHELPWIEEIFGDLIGEHVFDGNHEIVLDNSLLFDSFIKRVPHEYYRRFEGKNAFLVHFLDETYDGGYERYDPFRGIIRNYWSTAFNTERVFVFSGGLHEPRQATVQNPDPGLQEEVRLVLCRRVAQEQPARCRQGIEINCATFPPRHRGDLRKTDARFDARVSGHPLTKRVRSVSHGQR